MTLDRQDSVPPRLLGARSPGILSYSPNFEVDALLEIESCFSGSSCQRTWAQSSADIACFQRGSEASLFPRIPSGRSGHTVPASSSSKFFEFSNFCQGDPVFCSDAGCHRSVAPQE